MYMQSKITFVNCLCPRFCYKTPDEYLIRRSCYSIRSHIVQLLGLIINLCWSFLRNAMSVDYFVIILLFLLRYFICIFIIYLLFY